MSGLDDVLYRFEASILAEETEKREEATSARVAEVGEVLGMCTPVHNEVRDVLGVYARKAYQSARPPAPKTLAGAWRVAYRKQWR